MAVWIAGQARAGPGAVEGALAMGLCAAIAPTALVLLVALRLTEAAFFLLVAIWTRVLPAAEVPSSQESKRDAGQLLAAVMDCQIPISSRSVAPGAQLALW